MDLNFIFFPAPKKKYTPQQHQGELIWIPKLVYEDKSLKQSLLKRSTSQKNSSISLYQSQTFKNINKEKITSTQNFQIQKASQLTLKGNTTNHKDLKFEQQKECSQSQLISNQSQLGKSSVNFGSVLQTRVQFQNKPFKKEENIDQSTIDEECISSNADFMAKSIRDGVKMFQTSDKLDDEEHKPIDVNILLLSSHSPKSLIPDTNKNFVQMCKERNQNKQCLQEIQEKQQFQQKIQKPLSFLHPNLQGNFFGKENNGNSQNKDYFTTFSSKQKNSEHFSNRQSINLEKLKDNNQTLFKTNHQQSKSILDTSNISLNGMTENIDENIPQNLLTIFSPKHIQNYQHCSYKSNNISSKQPRQFKQPSTLLSTTSQTSLPSQNKQSLIYHSQSNENISLNSSNNLLKKQEQSSVNNNSTKSSLTSISKEFQFEKQVTNSIQKESDSQLLVNIARDEKQSHIPCLYLKSLVPSNYILIYFHGNGEDISLSYELTDHIRRALQVNVLVMEYQGYGLYEGQVDENQILKDTLYIYNFITQKLQFNCKNILVMGRSIGTGPATWLAANQDIGALILVSPFTSIRAIVKHVAGSFAQHLIKERFVNIENIKKVTCPSFIVHGQMDTLIPYGQSQELHDACQGPCQLILPHQMTHQELNFNNDLTIPLGKFLLKNEIDISKDIERLTKSEVINLPLSLFTLPNMKKLI